MINFDEFSEKILVFRYLLLYLHIPTYKYSKNMEDRSFRQRIIDMKRGESITISVEGYAYTTIRSYASDLGFAFNRTYSTKRNREDRTYTITRTA